MEPENILDREGDYPAESILDGAPELMTDGGREMVEVADGVSVYIDDSYATDGGRRRAMPTGGAPSYCEPRPRQGDDPDGYMAL